MELNLMMGYNYFGDGHFSSRMSLDNHSNSMV